MNLKRTLSFSVFIILACLASSAQAVIVTFDRSAADPDLGREAALNVDLGSSVEIFGGVPVSATFQGIEVNGPGVAELSTLTPDAGLKLDPADDPNNPMLPLVPRFPGYARFGDSGGITFSGGAVLENPTETAAIQFASGTILYGTANAPSTGVETVPPSVLGLSNEITIDIALGERITSVEGLLINGLNTTGQNFLAEYMVEFFIDDGMNPILPDSYLIRDEMNQAGTVVNPTIGSPTIELESNQDQGNAIFKYLAPTGSAITQVLITAIGKDFDPDDMEEILEWDFFIDTIAFNENIENVVPIPAALPLFLSALLGGWVFARPRRSRAN